MRISGVVGGGFGITGQVCFVESQGFKHAGFTETFGIGGQSPGAGISLGLQFSNAKLPNDLRGIFGYANGSVTIGPDVGPTAGGSGFIGESRCNRTIAGATIEGGIGEGFHYRSRQVVASATPGFRICGSNRIVESLNVR